MDWEGESVDCRCNFPTPCHHTFVSPKKKCANESLKKTKNQESNSTFPLKKGTF